MKRPLFLPVTLTLLASLATGMAHSGEVKIGHVGPFSGLLKDRTEEDNKLIRAYFEDVNKKGGVNGNKISIVQRDDGYNAAKFADMAKELIEKEKPVAFIGAAGCGGITEATKQKIFESAGVPLIAPICGSPSARQTPFIFHIRASWPEEMQKLVQQMQALGRQRIGVLYQNDPDGRLGLGLARSYLKQSGMEVVATGGFEKNTVKVESAVKTIADQNPDTVMLLGPDDAVAEFAKQYRKAGNGAQFYTISVVGAEDLVKAAGIDAVRGTGISQVMPFINSGTIPLTKEFRALCKKANVAPNYIAYEYFVGAKLVHEGLKRAGKDVDGTKLIAAIESITDFNMGGYRLNFGTGNRVGSKFIEITLIGPTGELIK